MFCEVETREIAIDPMDKISISTQTEENNRKKENIEDGKKIALSEKVNNIHLHRNKRERW